MSVGFGALERVSCEVTELVRSEEISGPTSSVHLYRIPLRLYSSRLYPNFLPGVGTDGP